MHKKIFIVLLLLFLSLSSSCFAAYKAGIKDYDYYVATDGSGDFTSIATALSVAGENKSIFVKRGTYNETDHVVFSSYQNVYFDSATISMATGKQMKLNSINNVNLSGKLTLTGDAAMLLYSESSSQIHGEGCIIELLSTRTAFSDWEWICFISGDVDSEFNIAAHDVTINPVGSHYFVYVQIANCTSVRAKVRLYHLTTSAATGNLQGFSSTGNTKSIFDVDIDTITTSDSHGTGIVLNNTTYSVLTGVTRSCNTNYSAGGTNTGLITSTLVI